MTLTIDLTPAEQARLTASARRTGLEPTALAKRLVTDHLPMDSDAASTSTAAHEQDRLAAIHAARGSMATVGVTVDDLHRERQADKEKEERLGTEAGH